MGTGYAIAAGHEVTAAAAAEVLAAGGTAVDAVIAGAHVAMVAEPVLAGLLGGGFLMVREPDGRLGCLDMFVDTPARRRPDAEIDLQEAIADFGTTTQRFRVGAGAIAVPGLTAGFAEAHARGGRIPMAELLAPAIRMAREGVAITAFQARLSQIVAPILTHSLALRALTCDGDGLPLGEGAVYRNPDFADVLEVLAHEGSAFVQQGEIAAGLAALSRDGGHLDRADLARWQPRDRRPLRIRRGRAHIALNPLPAVGGVLTALPLGLLPQTRRLPDTVALARAFAATALARLVSGLDGDGDAGAAMLADPDIRDALAPEARGAADWWAEMRAALTEATDAGVAPRGTTHLSAIDAMGGAAALTLSNGEGCGLVIPGTGIQPNNMLGEDDLVPPAPDGGPGFWLPGRRLASMMTPAILSVDDGHLVALGSGGSNRIRTAMAQVLLRVIDATPAGRLPDLEAAITAPRLHVEVDDPAEPPTLFYEREGLPEDEEMRLVADWPRGDSAPTAFDAPSMFFGGVHAVAGQPGRSAAAFGDPRRAGVGIVG
ncbi:MAG: gamma-glutamyltransferase [Pseudomonadota bacterium]